MLIIATLIHSSVPSQLAACAIIPIPKDYAGENVSVNYRVIYSRSNFCKIIDIVSVLCLGDYLTASSY